MPFKLALTDDPDTDAVALFLSDSDAETDDKEEFDRLVNIEGDGQLRGLLLKFADWCFDVGFADGQDNARWIDHIKGAS